METDQIYSELTKLFRDMFDDDTIVLTPDTTADDIEDWDSLAHINLIAAIEARMKIRFRVAEIESMHKVGHLIEVIHQKTT